MRHSRTISVVAALLLFASSCGGDDAAAPGQAGGDGTSAPTTTSTPTTTTPTTTTVAPTTTSVAPLDLAPADGDDYAALGSSIASGFGISVQSTSCGRSDRSYPNLVAAEFGLSLTDVSCGAAVISNVVDRSQGDFPPQIEVVSPLTKLITVSVGGNDIGLNGSAVVCSDPATICSEPDELEAKVAGLRPHLTGMIEMLRSTAPDATFVLVTYPREFPEDNCSELSLADEELAMLRSMGERLDEAFVDVAEETGVVLVDPYAEPGDHTGCAPEADRWVAGATAADGFAFHPTALGHQVMADMIIAALGGEAA